MRIFKNSWFNRFADREGITDSELKDAVKLLEAGLPDADLGGGVYKCGLRDQEKVTKYKRPV